MLKNLKKIDLFICVILALFGIAWLHSIHIRSWHFDDSFFGYTYARNLADGNGFTFNGAKVIGTTAPLPVLLYSGIARVLNTDNIVAVAEYTSISAIVLSSILLYFFVLDITGLKLAAFLSGLSYFINIFILLIFGHESIVALFLILVALVLNAKKKHVPSYFVLGLSCLCRAESIFAMAYMFFKTLEDKPPNRKNIKIYAFSAVLFSIPLLVWFSFSFVYFGQLFSNSFKFKILQLAFTNGHFLTDLFYVVRLWIGGNNIGLMALYSTISVLTIAFLNIFKNKNYFILIMALGVIPIVFYCAIKIAFYHWFLFLFCLLQSILVGVSLKVIFELYAGEKIQTKVSKYLLCAILIAPFFYSNYKFLKQRGGQVSSVTEYQTIGEYLRDNTPPDASIGYIEVGQIGYYSRRKIIDLTGMVTKDVVEHLKLRDFNWTYEEYKPDYILDNPSFTWLYEFAKSNIKSRYTLIHTFDSGLYLYKRNK